MATNDLYQSTFMPTFQKAEIKIKMLVLAAFLYATSIIALRLKIDGVIKWVADQIPKDLNDRMAYLRGLKVTSERYISLYYKKPQRAFNEVKKTLLSTLPKGKVTPTLNNPKQMLDFTENKQNMWAEAKASPTVVNYPKEIKRRIEEMAANPTTTFEPGKKPISLWQKAELDVRYEAQMKMVDDLKKEGVQYAWTSSHPDCSKRCAPWQGKLMDLTSHAKGPNHQVTTIDGHPVYSLTDIMAKTDKYGYHNNIICGFNCRHHLIPYKPGISGPKQYTEKDVKKQRAIEERIRVMEREIRKLKTQAALYEQAGEIKIANTIKNRVKILVSKYKAFCEHYGYSWNEYRIRIY